jgi:acetyl esterase
MRLRHTSRKLTYLLCVLGLGWCRSAVVAETPRDRPTAPGQNARQYPPELPDAKVEVYKTVGDVSLKLYLFLPPDHQPSDRRPAIVFFFGGGWRAGSPGQFAPQCRYFASRGLVAAAADYRVESRHGVTPVDCVRDAKSAIRFVRANAAQLGVDSDRIVAAGGSAGGHLAASTAIVPELDEAGEDGSVSSAPNALALFNPAVILAPYGGRSFRDPERTERMNRATGGKPETISPIHHVRAGLPPTIVFHGEADTTVPYASVVEFTKVMTAAENRCELVGYPGQRHGFFNHREKSDKNSGGPTMYERTTRRMDEFLGSLGYLEGEPTIGSSE